MAINLLISQFPSNSLLPTIWNLGFPPKYQSHPTGVMHCFSPNDSLFHPLILVWKSGFNLLTKFKFQKWTGELLFWSETLEIPILRCLSTFPWADKVEPSSQGGPEWKEDRLLCREPCVSGSRFLWEVIYQVFNVSLSSEVNWMFPKIPSKSKVAITHSTKTSIYTMLCAKQCHDAGKPALKRRTKSIFTFRKHVWFSRA